MATTCQPAHWWTLTAGAVALVCGQCGERLDLADVDREDVIASVALHHGELAGQRFSESLDLALERIE